MRNKHYIYEIFGKKIGVTNDVVRRMKEQNAKEGEYRIIEEHTNAKVASKREKELQVLYGYPVDRIEYWKTLRWQKKALTKKAIEKRVANTNWKARTKNFDYKTKSINTDYKARSAKTDYKIIATKRKKPVNQYDLQGNFIKKWDSAKDAGLAFGRKTGGDVNSCCRGIQLTAYKFIWKYAN